MGASASNGASTTEGKPSVVPVKMGGVRVRSQPACVKSKILNPETGKCVSRNGAIGKKLLSAPGKLKPVASVVTKKAAKKAKHTDGCELHEQTTKKYTSRPGPPYPANNPECRGTVMIGNDNKFYKSQPNSRNIYTWRKL